MRIISVFLFLTLLVSCEDGKVSENDPCDIYTPEEECVEKGCSFLPVLYTSHKENGVCDMVQNVPGMYVCMRGEEPLSVSRQMTVTGQLGERTVMFTVESSFASFEGFEECASGDLSCICSEEEYDPIYCFLAESEYECLASLCSDYTPLVARGLFDGETCFDYESTDDFACLNYEGDDAPPTEETLYWRLTSNGTEVAVFSADYGDIFGWTRCDDDPESTTCGCPER